mgnify:CR=1 FL=1
MPSFDENMMKRAIALATKGAGHVSPNPLVGAVVVKDGQIIGEGWHAYFGGPHAEVNAIKSLDNNVLINSTLYVNLEPCSHFGKTPPCTSLIIEKRISKVVIGMQDPNPLVAGKGIKALSEAGIQVELGVLEEKCKWLNRFFVKHITTAMPYVVAKAAQSLDGAIALRSGQSKWISCTESRRRAHQLRAELDAVLIGKATALTDNPSLTVRDVRGRNPIRIVFDTNLSLPSNLNVFQRKNENLDSTKTIVCCSEQAYSNSNKFREEECIELLAVKLNAKGQIDLKDALSKLYKYHSIGSILLEGGAELASSFIEENLIDELHLFVAPIIIGDGKRFFEKFNLMNLPLAPKYDIKHVRKSDEDIEIIAISHKD